MNRRPRTLLDRIWDAHEIRPGLVAIDRVMLHERTGAAALKALKSAGRPVVRPAHVFAVMDHIVDTRPGRGDGTLMPGGEAFLVETRAAARAAGITLFDVNDPDQGITHVISPELGIVLPGLTLVAPDSHTGTQGAFGALAWGIGSSEAEHALATGTLRVARPSAMRVDVRGRLRPGVVAKDLALHLIATHGARGAEGMVVEFSGPAVAALDMEARMTLANMATEFGAFSALIAPDETTFAWLEGRRFAPRGPLWEAALQDWRALRSDPNAPFAKSIEVDADMVAPMISWGTSPQHSVPVTGRVPSAAAAGLAPETHARALAYMGLAEGQPLMGLPIDGAFIGSCTNSRLSDLERAAAILKGRRVAPSVRRALVVPGSQAVKRAAEARGLDRIFRDAGFEWREPGCSLCFFAGGESFGAGERVVSSTNRNFESRQGPGTRTHITSPEVVAASAVAGRIAAPWTLP
ncbi:MAG: 3-isopropylmalate dehydratase large subunit [Sphingomonadaceae bacterium]|uniref:3-isopropylmalate dehydratase large subunit n=1 Tax=Thermaurantiacus sp. TaxID=2820283 RepID=UPI00298F1A45|nr:3-isopropylmalate dehydratase large subunit [Thermaurantiacus sp.]MCS6986796.1 3-isopropylmalate dehydratase large subunit [Sphingomonadaceae bacterium]MDW8413941.1 3-isopropylmalate dehydratase large subunit [Thermaurantiacus sp.]